ncbi:MAG: hypothetical protein ACTS8S_15405 [Giesbergeria sp.]|jgi:hypothetical protein|nr:MAG: hypothetical protein BGO35_16370 [Burkholderiales bacterium 64-34]
MKHRLYWIVTLLLAASLTGCATPVYEDRLAWKDGWRTGVVVQIEAGEDLRRRYRGQCVFSAQPQSIELLAVVRWKSMNRVRWRVVALPSSTSIEMNSAVYVNVYSCESVLEKRSVF